MKKSFILRCRPIGINHLSSLVNVNFGQTPIRAVRWWVIEIKVGGKKNFRLTGRCREREREREAEIV